MADSDATVDTEDIDHLIRAIASKCEVALHRDDPVILMHAGTMQIVKDALSQAAAQQSAVLSEHRSALELAGARWHSDVETTARAVQRQLLSGVQEVALSAIEQAAAEHLAQLRREHDRQQHAMGRAVTLVTIAAALTVGASALGVVL